MSPESTGPAANDTRPSAIDADADTGNIDDADDSNTALALEDLKEPGNDINRESAQSGGAIGLVLFLLLSLHRSTLCLRSRGNVLREPHRLVIDLPETRLATPLPDGEFRSGV